MVKIKFRGEEAFVGDEIPKAAKLTLYGIRHSDLDWDDPITIEPRVVVNRWGVIGFREPLEPSLFDENDSIVLWEGEKDILREAMERWLRLKGGMENEAV